MKPIKNPFCKYTLLFLLFCSLILIVNSVWILKNNISPRGNGLDHLYDALTNYGKYSFFERSANLVYNYFKPYTSSYDHHSFLSYIYSMFYDIFGPLTKKELILNLIFLFLSMWAIFKTASLLYTKKIGLLSVIIFS